MFYLEQKQIGSARVIANDASHPLKTFLRRHCRSPSPERLPEPHIWPQYLQSRIIVSPSVLVTTGVCHERKSVYSPVERSFTMLDRKYISIDLTMYKYRSLSKASSLPAYQILEVLPKSKAWPCSLPINWSGVWLLLGKGCFKSLMMLFQHTNGLAMRYNQHGLICV